MRLVRGPAVSISYQYTMINSSPPGQNDCNIADDIYKHMFMNEKFCVLIEISPKFVPKDPVDNKSALVQVMAWHRTGDKPLAETILKQFTETYIRH